MSVAAALALFANVWPAWADGEQLTLTSDRFDCVIKPSMEVQLSSTASGVVKQMRVDRGDIVRAGDVIAQLKSDVEEANVALAKRQTEGAAKIAAAQARVDFFKAKHARIRDLNSKKIASDGSLDEIRMELAVAEQTLFEANFNQGVAKLELERAQAQLDQKTIVSPVNGVIVERSLAPGEFLSDEKRLVRIASIDPLHVEAFVPVALHGQVKVGGNAVIEPDAPIGGRYTAVIQVLDRVYDAASGTFGIRLTLANPELSLPAGIRCGLRLQLLDRDAASARARATE